MTDLHYDDPVAGSPLKMKSRQDGDSTVPAHDVAALPGTVEADIGFIKTFLNTVAGAIASGRMLVDLSAAVTANIATLAGAITAARMAVDLASTPTANLATLAGAITSARMAVNVDSTTQGKVDAISAAQAPPTAFYGGKKTVAAAGTNVQLQASSQPLTEGVLLRGLDANVGLVYPGNASVTSSGNGSRVAAREPCFIRIDNLNKVYIDAAVNGEGVTFLAW